MRKLGVDGIETESVAEYTCVAELGLELESEHIALFLHNLELLDARKRLLAILLTIYHHLEAKITAETIGVYSNLDSL